MNSEACLHPCRNCEVTFAVYNCPAWLHNGDTKNGFHLDYCCEDCFDDARVDYEEPPEAA